MTPADTESIARRFLQAYAAKDLGTIAGLLADDVLLRDWNLQVIGREPFLVQTQRNFDDVGTIAIDVLDLHDTDRSAAAEVLITVGGSIRMRVVDVFDIGAGALVTAVRSYKGLEP